MPKPIQKSLLDTIKTKPDATAHKGAVNVRDYQLHGSKGLYSAKVSAIANMSDGSVLATLPEIMDARINADLREDIFTCDITSVSEEFPALDMDGKYYPAGTELIVVNHSDSYLSSSLLKGNDQARIIINSSRASKFVADGMLPGKEFTKIVPYKDLSAPQPRNYAVVIPRGAVTLESKLCTKKEIMENPLMIARAGGEERLERYINQVIVDKFSFIANSQNRFHSPTLAYLRVESREIYNGVGLQDMASQNRTTFLSVKEVMR